MLNVGISVLLCSFDLAQLQFNAVQSQILLHECFTPTDLNYFRVHLIVLDRSLNSTILSIVRYEERFFIWRNRKRVLSDVLGAVMGENILVMASVPVFLLRMTSMGHALMKETGVQYVDKVNYSLILWRYLTDLGRRSPTNHNHTRANNLPWQSIRPVESVFCSTNTPVLVPITQYSVLDSHPCVTVIPPTLSSTPIHLNFPPSATPALRQRDFLQTLDVGHSI